MTGEGAMPTETPSARVRKELGEIARARLARFERIVNEALRFIDATADDWVRAVKESRLKR